MERNVIQSKMETFQKKMVFHKKIYKKKQKEIEKKDLPLPMYLLDLTNKYISNFRKHMNRFVLNQQFHEYFLLSLYQHQVVKD